MNEEEAKKEIINKINDIAEEINSIFIHDVIGQQVLIKLTEATLWLSSWEVELRDESRSKQDKS